MTFDGRILAGVSVLAAVIDGGSFTKGADLIGITASGVSRAIARLEARLGIRLLDRTTRSIRLTDDGRRFYEQVKPHLTGIEEAAITASGATTSIRGRLKVDMDPFFLPFVLAGQLSIFCARYPDLSIEFVSSVQIGDLVSDGIDMAVRFGRPRFATLITKKLADAVILTVASPNYIARYGRPERPQDVSTHRCLQFRDPHTNQAFDWEFTRGKRSVAVNTEGPLLFGDPTTLLKECIAGAGIAQLIEWGITDFLTRGELVDLFPDWHGERFSLYAIHPSRKHPPAKVQAFSDFCVEMIDNVQSQISPHEKAN